MPGANVPGVPRQGHPQCVRLVAYRVGRDPPGRYSGGVPWEPALNAPGASPGCDLSGAVRLMAVGAGFVDDW